MLLVRLEHRRWRGPVAQVFGHPHAGEHLFAAGAGRRVRADGCWEVAVGGERGGAHGPEPIGPGRQPAGLVWLVVIGTVVASSEKSTLRA